MLPEMFWSANDCACRPETDVVRASKIPIPLLQLRPRRPADSGKPGRSRGRRSQGPCQCGKFNYVRYLSKRPRSRDQGLNCRAGQQLPTRWSGRGCVRRFEDEAKSVDAIAQAGRLRAVVEDM